MKLISFFIFMTAITFYSFAMAAELNPVSLNLTDWPNDVVEKMKKEVPELNQKNFLPAEFNFIIKKLDQKMQFNSLKIIQNGNEYRLVGEISAVVDKIEFQGLEEISESDALGLLNLNIKNALDEESLKAASDKLSDYYKELGYRFAEVKYEVISNSTIKKTILFRVNIKKQTRLTEVKVEGIDPKTKQDIEAQLRLYIFKPVLNQETLNQYNTKLRQQLSMNGYYLTQVNSPQIIFSANELSARLLYKLKPTTQYSIEIINSVQFPQFPISYLENEVLKLASYFSKDPNFGAELIEKLKSFYISEGYPHIEIAYYERKEGQKIMTTFNIEEGGYTRLSQLKFTGQLSRPESYYKNKFYDLASSKLQDKIFIKEDIENAAKNLLTDLQNEGFVNARLGRIQVSTDRENPKIGIATIQLDEGSQVIIDTIQFDGLYSESSTKLKEIMKLHEGQNLNLTQLEQALYLLKNHFTSLGFIEFKLLNESKDLMTYSDKNSKAHLKFTIQEGAKVEVQSILLEGNEVTHDKVILTELDFKLGDILTPAKIEESISRLQKTGHFNSVEISTIEANTNISQRTVLIKLNESNAGIFTIGTGATNENNGTLRGYIGGAHSNIGGWGRGVSLRLEGNYNFADIKYLESKIILAGVEPYLFESRARLRANITRSRSISDIAAKKVTELNLGVISVEQDFTSNITGIWDIWSVATYNDHGITPEDERNNGYVSESSVIGSTGPSLILDYRDNLLNPNRGIFTKLSVEYASQALSNNNVDDFVRFTGQSTFYVPITQTSLVFAQSFSGGYIQDLQVKDSGVPYDKKGFTLGGRSTIRGFGSLEFFPSSQPNSSQFIGTAYKLTTFASYSLVKSELRFPVVAKWDLMGAFFYDGGQVVVDGFDFTDTWRDALGLGIRYNTPIGALNLEYAQKLDRKQGESEGAFHLSVGVF